MELNSRKYRPATYRQWRREGGDRGTLRGAAFEGRKFGILAFALQYISVSLDSFFNLFSALRTGVAGWMGGTTDLRPGRQKPSRRHCVF